MKLFSLVCAVIVLGGSIGCATNSQSMKGQLNCAVTGKLWVQFGMWDGEGLGERERSEFENEKLFTKTEDPFIKKAFEESCRRVTDKISESSFVLGRVYDPRTKKSLWLFADDRLVLDEKLVVLEKRIVTDLYEAVDELFSSKNADKHPK